ncbi:MAG TPA: helix-turn-helix domain-containing protein [Geodermatophilus sp.]|nr:helix-turn-helix domain-containing protein [Geodermatophilus sp.]
MVDLADAASVLHEARRRAGLTQAELGRRAGVTQSVVSAYESGRRQPSPPVLLRLLRASGHVLDASLVAAEPAGLSGPLGRRVWQHRHRITAVAASHGVRRVRVFGSVARGTETPGSDVDLLVDLPEGMGLFALGACASTWRRSWAPTSTWCRPTASDRTCARTSRPIW